eukprot:gene9941-10990_t
MSNTESADSASRCPTCGCVGPNPGYEPMNENEILAEMSTLRTTWQLAADQKSISRQFVCRNWQAAMNALQAIGQCAERADIQHHPDLHLTNYREVEVRISTHAFGGLTKCCLKFVVRGDYLSLWCDVDYL